MKPVVFKVGGALLDKPEAIVTLFQVLAKYSQVASRPWVLVHGGGCVVDQLLQRLNFNVEKKKGLRVTPSEQIDVIVGALAGIANTHLVAYAKQQGLNPVGLSLADGEICRAEVFDPELGRVANSLPNRSHLLNLLLQQGYLPIISSIAVDDQARLMNVNADQAACSIATLLEADLVLLSDVAGVLDQQGQLIAELNAKQVKQLIAENIITEGMIVKVEAALATAQQLQRAVEIASWKQPEQVAELLLGKRAGTRILP
ncbi:acetylglutamate kinase [Mergibacter septicus]|uniref:acetylglutamate kinase n=1 Tax=Mergibacter septicus TaxID=221402 RepID=UPI00117982A5|nr:acetylglutamate kinase [Mergibacter septicus]AWX13194.1 acetylglutamate kinase [Mergibacter septicus]